MFDIITYSILVVCLVCALYLTGLSLRRKNNSKPKSVLEIEQDLITLEKNLNERMDLLMDAIFSVELNTRYLLDKKADERLQKLEGIVVDLNGKINDHCEENERSFIEIIEDSTKLKKEFTDQMIQLQVFKFVAKMTKQGNILGTNNSIPNDKSFNRMREDISKEFN